MNQERVVDARTAGTIAANLLWENGASGGNPLAERPEVKAILDDLRGIPKEQIKEVLVFLGGNGHQQEK